MEQPGSQWTEFHEILYLGIFLKICREKFKFLSYLTRLTSTLHEDQYIFWIIFRSILPEVRNISEKCRENQNTHFVFNKYQEKWLQHVQRMDTKRLPKQALQYKPKDEET